MESIGKLIPSIKKTIGGGGGGGTFRSPIALETSALIDVATDAALIANFWYVYNDLDFRRQDLMEISGDPHVILVQFTGVLIGIYLIQMIYDWKME